MVEGPDTKDWLEKLAADKGIQIPLVYLAKGPQDLGMRLYKLAPGRTIPFLVNDNRQVESQFCERHRRLTFSRWPGCHRRKCSAATRLSS